MASTAGKHLRCLPVLFCSSLPGSGFDDRDLWLGAQVLCLMISSVPWSAVVHGVIVDKALTTLTKCLSSWRMAGVLSVGARRVLPGHLLRRSQVLSSLPVGLSRFQQRVAVTGACMGQAAQPRAMHLPTQDAAQNPKVPAMSAGSPLPNNACCEPTFPHATCLSGSLHTYIPHQYKERYYESFASANCTGHK